MAKHRCDSVSAAGCGIWDEDAQHELNISTFAGRLLEQRPPRCTGALRLKTQLRTEESTFIRATGAASPAQGKLRRPAQPAGWGGLTLLRQWLKSLSSSSGSPFCGREFAPFFRIHSYGISVLRISEFDGAVDRFNGLKGPSRRPGRWIRCAGSGRAGSRLKPAFLHPNASLFRESYRTPL